MSDLTNPNTIPSDQESEDDKELLRLGESIHISFSLSGRDALEFRRQALKTGMTPDNYGKTVALTVVRRLRSGLTADGKTVKQVKYYGRDLKF